MNTLLALPAPGNPLERYLAHREATLQNPQLIVRTRPLPAAWFQAAIKEAAAKEATAWRKMRNTQLRRIRRLAKRVQAKWPPLAGTKQPFSESITWIKDGSIPDSDTTVLIAAQHTETGEGFHDGERWRWASGAVVDWPVIAWADMPSGPYYR